MPSNEEWASGAWADVVTLGEARFGRLQGGPFDGRCWPLLEGTPCVLHVPVEGSGIGPASVRTLRYELIDGVYRFAECTDRALPAA